MKPVDINSNTYIDFGVKIMIKILNLKLVTIPDYQNIKTFLQKVTLQIDLKKFLCLKKVKNTVLWIYVISDVNGEEIY